MGGTKSPRSDIGRPQGPTVGQEWRSRVSTWEWEGQMTQTLASNKIIASATLYNYQKQTP